MEACMDSWMLLFPSNITSDFSDIIPTNSSDDAFHSMLISQDCPVDSLEWIYEDKFHLPSPCQQLSCHKDKSKGEDANSPPLLFPGLDMELDLELGIFHLLKAYGEAVEEGCTDLAQVILTRLLEKANPIGTMMERLSHYLLVQQSNPRSEYLIEECIKNYAMAFQAFYEITPYSRFAHFVANSAIHEAVPRDVETIHIIDFDAGDGIQWPPLLSALGTQCLVRLSCIDMEENYKFERMKERLVCFAKSMGLNLRVDCPRLEELLLEKRRVTGVCASVRELLVFNCMVGLPHMSMDSNKGRSQVERFIEVAQELAVSLGRRGILTYANCSSGEQVPFSDGHLLHSHALFESMEWHFPSSLSLARTTMECLFVGTCMSSFRLFDELRLVRSNLKGCQLSKQNIMEAKEMVRGGNYDVKVRGDVGNEMVLEWRGTPLVRVCAWR